jgi:excisionase family DNA binding protein
MVATDRETPPYYSPEGLAALLNVPVGTVYRWNYERTGPPRVRVGKHVRYRREDVEAWISSRTERHP